MATHTRLNQNDHLLVAESEGRFKTEVFLDKTHMDCRSDAVEQEGDKDQGPPFYIHLISWLHKPCLMCQCLLRCHS